MATGELALAALRRIAGARKPPSKRTSQRNTSRSATAAGTPAILIADVLAIYLTDIAPQHAREGETRQRVLKLDEWWGTRTLADINGPSCRAYAAWRTGQVWKSATPGSPGARKVTTAAARRELEDLRAALRYHHREGLCSEAVQVVLPEKPMARERWLTRSEAARLLWAARRYRETQKGVETDRRSRRPLPGSSSLASTRAPGRRQSVTPPWHRRRAAAGWILSGASSSGGPPARGKRRSGSRR